MNDVVEDEDDKRFFSVVRAFISGMEPDERINFLKSVMDGYCTRCGKRLFGNECKCYQQIKIGRDW